MSEELEQLSPLALPASRKPVRARHQPPKKAATMQSATKPKQRDLSSMATGYLTREPMDIEAEASREQGDVFPIPDVTSIGRQTIEQHLDEQNAEITDALSLAPEAPPTLLRRRTQDEMLRALRLLASGTARPRDDDSPQVLEDAVYEVASLRQIVADLMQASTNMYQAGLASIRKMTER